MDTRDYCDGDAVCQLSRSGMCEPTELLATDSVTTR